MKPKKHLNQLQINIDFYNINMSDNETDDPNGVYHIFAPLLINLRINPKFHSMLPFDRRMKLIEKLEHFLFLHPEPVEDRLKYKLTSKIRAFVAHIQVLDLTRRGYQSADIVFEEFIKDLHRYHIIPQI